jgi:hypothetical protein
MLVGRDFGIWFFPSTDSPMRMICSDRSSLNRLRADYTIGKKKNTCLHIFMAISHHPWVEKLDLSSSTNVGFFFLLQSQKFLEILISG